jgi:hypothetical protein
MKYRELYPSMGEWYIQKTWIFWKIQFWNSILGKATKITGARIRWDRRIGWSNVGPNLRIFQFFEKNGKIGPTGGSESSKNIYTALRVTWAGGVGECKPSGTVKRAQRLAMGQVAALEEYENCNTQ